VQTESNPIFFDSMTGHLSSGIQPDEPRNFSHTALISIKAAAVENTARGKVYGSGNLTFELDMLWFLAAKLGDGAQQGLGVGVTW